MLISKNKCILVTGAAGHLGNVLVRELVARNVKVRAMVLPGEDLASLEGLDVEIFEGNILDKDRLFEACEGVDLVFHLASLVAITEDKIALMQRVNVEGTRNVIEAVRQAGVRRLVYTSSIHALQRPDPDVMIDESLQFDRTTLPVPAAHRQSNLAGAGSSKTRLGRCGGLPDRGDWTLRL